MHFNLIWGWVPALNPMGNDTGLQVETSSLDVDREGASLWELQGNPNHFAGKTDKATTQKCKM